MRLVALAGVAVCIATVAASAPVEVRTRAIDRFGDAIDASRVEFLGGLVLSGPRGFGGFSGLLTEGDRLLAVSDTGDWLSARMVLDGDRLTGLADAEFTPRNDRAGRPITAKNVGDAEALALLDGKVVVMVENQGALIAYPQTDLVVPGDAPARSVEAPPGLRVSARRGGREALAALPSGTLLAFAEGRDEPQVTPAWRIPGEPFTVARSGGFQITGASALPGGDVVLIERRYGGGLDVGMRIRRLPANGLAAGPGPVDGPVLLEADFSDEIDNMEAIAAEVIDGRIILTVMSDDNLGFLQRTLLLRFAVADPLPPRHPRDFSD